jgi:hypothetical protein
VSVRTRVQTIVCLLLCAVSASAQKADTQNRELRGPSLFVLDDRGYLIAAEVDKTDASVPAGRLRIVLDPPGTTGGRPIARVIAPPSSPVPGGFCETEDAFVWPGPNYQLTFTPLPNTIVKMIWQGVEMDRADFSIAGQAATVLAKGWIAGDRIRFRYFYKC